MTAVTANPVTINAEQVLRSDYVVKATLSDDPASGSSTDVLVEQTWVIAEKHKPLSEMIQIDNLHQTDARQGRTYFMPLTKNGDGSYHVTETRLPQAPPMIYPAGVRASEQLEKVLESL